MIAAGDERHVHPLWIIPISARTAIVAVDETQQVAQTATTAALMGVILGGMGGEFEEAAGAAGAGDAGGRFDIAGSAGSMMSGLRGGAFLGGLTGTMMYRMGGMGMGGGEGENLSQLDQNYNFPVVAMKDLTEYQPHDYAFALSQRVLFDVSKLDKSIKVLDGDVGGGRWRGAGKTLVGQAQSQKAHDAHHMIQQIHTDMDVSDGELLHVPVWFVRYDHKGNKMIFVIDGNCQALPLTAWALVCCGGGRLS